VQRENLVALRLAYDALVKSGRDSLAAAYDFGQIVDALSNLYTFKVMGAELDRHESTIGLYARLYRTYPNKKELLDTAFRYGTWDVSRLARGATTVALQFGYQCRECGSFNTHRVQKEHQHA